MMLCIVIIFEAVSWSAAYASKILKVENAGGILFYVGRFLRSMVIPESISVYITVTLIDYYHKFRGINSVKNDWPSIGHYELKFLPVISLSFLVFNPITQTVRFFLEQFPAYTLNNYIQDYILHTYSWRTYFQYIFPIILIGYIALNISLLKDFLQQRKQAQEKAEAEAAEASQKALALSTIFTPKPVESTTTYLAHLKGKNTFGELDFPVNDAYFFTIEDRFYYAELPKGRYMVVKTLNDLETELDPNQFFRIKRDYIVNRDAVLNYAYWENGKYIVRLNTPGRYEIVVPRARMQEFREWLQKTSPPDRASDALYASPHLN
ncbi:LytTR family DNA-binding domain-containing protein [Spirosoma profusum]|nr:LytTR family DNA-binding domain-containing protein [Spirosoma profusum]